MKTYRSVHDSEYLRFPQRFEWHQVEKTFASVLASGESHGKNRECLAESVGPSKTPSPSKEIAFSDSETNGNTAEIGSKSDTMAVSDPSVGSDKDEAFESDKNIDAMVKFCEMRGAPARFLKYARDASVLKDVKFPWVCDNVFDLAADVLTFKCRTLQGLQVRHVKSVFLADRARDCPKSLLSLVERGKRALQEKEQLHGENVVSTYFDDSSTIATTDASENVLTQDIIISEDQPFGELVVSPPPPPDEPKILEDDDYIDPSCEYTMTIRNIEYTDQSWKNFSDDDIEKNPGAWNEYLYLRGVEEMKTGEVVHSIFKKTWEDLEEIGKARYTQFAKLVFRSLDAKVLGYHFKNADNNEVNLISDIHSSYIRDWKSRRDLLATIFQRKDLGDDFFVGLLNTPVRVSL